eukprot:NODE_11381_length_1290_cov_5.987102.p1 GENE.NODE_11381_length_1290_cov_5.987102~~NODE_11381_length_1290_cov_5.987102.p1  ORF type:complete len:317 (+),score=65.60 NODE_11381_length_1290_cov_5.987102:99-1049(+)
MQTAWAMKAACRGIAGVGLSLVRRGAVPLRTPWRLHARCAMGCAATRQATAGSLGVQQHILATSPVLAAAGAVAQRHFSDIKQGEKQDGLVKMWNDERGFGFITTAQESADEDFFVHRSAIKEGGALQPGQAVKFEVDWDDRRRKYRISALWPGEVTEPVSGEQGADSGGARSPGGAGHGRRARAWTEPRAYHVASALEDWAISRKPMAPDGEGSTTLRHRIVVRGNAPRGTNGHREEFQIVGDMDWNQRLFPAGGFRAEVIVVQPKEEGSRAVFEGGKGHGRNWAVEGRPGAAIDIVYDTGSRHVTCEPALDNSK